MKQTHIYNNNDNYKTINANNIIQNNVNQKNYFKLI